MVNRNSQGEGTFLEPKWKRPKGKVFPLTISKGGGFIKNGTKSTSNRCESWNN